MSSEQIIILLSLFALAGLAIIAALRVLQGLGRVVIICAIIGLSVIVYALVAG